MIDNYLIGEEGMIPKDTIAPPAGWVLHACPYGETLDMHDGWTDLRCIAAFKWGEIEEAAAELLAWVSRGYKATICESDYQIDLTFVLRKAIDGSGEMHPVLASLDRPADLEDTILFIQGMATYELDMSMPVKMIIVGKYLGRSLGYGASSEEQERIMRNGREYMATMEDGQVFGIDMVNPITNRSTRAIAYRSGQRVYVGVQQDYLQWGLPGVVDSVNELENGK